jgi:hypothetical protein
MFLVYHHILVVFIMCDRDSNGKPALAINDNLLPRGLVMYSPVSISICKN